METRATSRMIKEIAHCSSQAVSSQHFLLCSRPPRRKLGQGQVAALESLDLRLNFVLAPYWWNVQSHIQIELNMKIIIGKNWIVESEIRKLQVLIWWGAKNWFKKNCVMLLVYKHHYRDIWPHLWFSWWRWGRDRRRWWRRWLDRHWRKTLAKRSRIKLQWNLVIAFLWEGGGGGGRTPAMVLWK